MVLRTTQVFISHLAKHIFNKSKHRLVLNHQRLFYDARTRSDTIFALATAISSPKGSPLGVIRISGSKTEQVLRLLTQRDPIRSKTALKSGIKPRNATLTNILYPFTQDPIDIGLVLWFPKPNSYTGEDSCELHIHGSRSIVSSILNSLGSLAGLRPAEPGEFTKRAVQNGKLSVLQAESLPDLIAAQTENQRKLALRGLDGSTSNRYKLWTDELIHILAHLEASIDFGEDELIGETVVVLECIEKLRKLSSNIASFIQSSSRSRDIIRHGIRLVILGKPNAGKSTFMNILCGQNKSIVSNLSGTTRDVVEHSLELGGHYVTVSDTAGLKNCDQQDTQFRGDKTLLEQHDEVEKEGIRRALEAARQSDIILYLVDGSDTLTVDQGRELRCSLEELEKQLEVYDTSLKPKKIYLVINKLDLNNCSSHFNFNPDICNTLKTKFPNIECNIFLISCKTGENLEKLVEHIVEYLNILASCQPSGNPTDGVLELEYVNERHLSLLRSVKRHLQEASELNMSTIDKMAQHVRESVDYLSRIVGTISNEQVFDVVFRDFCIGK